MITINNWIVFFILVLPAVKMYAITQFPMVDDFFDLFGIFSCVFLVVLSFPIRKRLVIPKGCQYIFMFLALLLLSTGIQYRDNLLGLISETSKILIVVLYLILAFSSGKRSFTKALCMFRKIYLIILFVDSFCLLVEMLGLQIYESNIFTVLGMDNYAAFGIVPMLSVIFYISYKTKSRIQTIDKLVFASCMAAKIATFSFTAIISMAVMAAVIYFSLHARQIRKNISPKFIICMVVVLIVGVVYFRMDKKIDLLLAGTGKGISNRTMIWSQTLKSIPKSPIIGFGYTVGDQFKKITGFYHVAWESTQTHPHNYILEILFYTGILGVLIYGGILSQLIKAIRRNIQNKITAVVLGGVVGFLVLSIPDGYILVPPIYVFLTVVYLENEYTKICCQSVGVE